MKLMTFTAPTPAQALKAAQQECGEDALVVSTKQIRKKSLSQTALYEVVVAIEDTPPQKRKKGKAAGVKETSSRKRGVEKEPPSVHDDVLVNISKAAKEISEIANLSTPVRERPRVKVEVEEDRGAPFDKRVEMEELKEIKGELLKLSDKIKLIQNMVWEISTR